MKALTRQVALTGFLKSCPYLTNMGKLGYSVLVGIEWIKKDNSKLFLVMFPGLAFIFCILLYYVIYFGVIYFRT